MAKEMSKRVNVPGGKSRDCVGDNGQNAYPLVCLSTFATGTVLYHQLVYQQLDRLDRQVQALERGLRMLRASIEEQYCRDSDHIATLAGCQRDTARALNQILERHMLFPTVEALVTLADEWVRLQVFVAQATGADDRDWIAALRSEIDIACSVASEKLTSVNAQRIAPSPGQDLDPEEYCVCGYTEPTDQDRPGTVCRLLTPGILYHGKVLKQARVIVFRDGHQEDSQD